MNAEEKPKAFSLAPPERDITHDILEARAQCCDDRTLKPDGVKVLFVRLLDLSLNKYINLGPGVIAISQTKLGSKLGKSVRTIYDWTRKLKRARYLWTTEIFMPNMKPMLVYHITALHAPDSKDYRTTPEGMWGNGTRQSKFKPSLGARGLRKPASVEEKPADPKKILQVVDTATLPGEASPLATVKSGRAPRRDFAVGHGEDSRLPTARSGRAQPQGPAVEHGETSPCATATDCQYKEARGGSSKFTEVKGGPTAPPDEALEKWIKGISGTPAHPTHRSKLEKLEAELQRERQLARTKASRDWVGKKLAAVRQLLNPKHPDELQPPAPSPVKLAPAPKSAPMPVEKSKALFQKAKKEARLE